MPVPGRLALEVAGPSGAKASSSAIDKALFDLVDFIDLSDRADLETSME